MLLIVTGCQSTTRVSVEPIRVTPPAVLMIPPKVLKPVAEDLSLKEALPVIVENNAICVDHSVRLELLQNWVKETEQAAHVRDSL